MLVLLQLNMINWKFFNYYFISHILSHTIAYCLTFQNSHFYLTINSRFISTIFLVGMVGQQFFGKAKQPLLTQQQPPPPQPRRSLVRQLLSSECILLYIIMAVFIATETGNCRYSLQPMDSPFLMYKDIIMAKLRLQPSTFNTLYYLCKPEWSFIDFDTLI